MNVRVRRVDYLELPMSRPHSGQNRIRTRVIALAVLLAGCGAQESRAAIQVPELTAEKTQRIEVLLRSHYEDSGVASLSAAVGIGAEVVWAGAVGHADLEYEIPADAGTLYRTASIAKWMTATAAMTLVEGGDLDLDAPIQDYCPQYPEKRWTLTARHLLTHRGGVRHYWGANGENPQTPEEREELQQRQTEERNGFTVRYTDVIGPLDGFKDDPLVFEPGQRFNYTSHGYRLLGCVLQGAAGEVYRELMRERVLGPSGMTSTVEDDAWEIIPGRARAYAMGPDGLRHDAFRDVSENLPAGGYLSTPTDLVRFALAFDRDVLISAASRQEMTTRPRFPNADPDEGAGFYGYGVQVGEMDGRTTLVHSGGQSGTSTGLLLMPDQDFAVSVNTNVSGQGVIQAVAMGIIEILLEGD